MLLFAVFHCNIYQEAICKKSVKQSDAIKLYCVSLVRYIDDYKAYWIGDNWDFCN